jgi:hypothetical protein
MLPPRFTPQKDVLVLIPVRGWMNFRAIVRVVGLSKLKNKTSGLIWTWTDDLLASNIAPQPTTLLRSYLPHDQYWVYSSVLERGDPLTCPWRCLAYGTFISLADITVISIIENAAQNFSLKVNTIGGGNCWGSSAYCSGNWLTWYSAFVCYRRAEGVQVSTSFMNWLYTGECLCGLVVRVPGYWTEMYCVSCEVRTEFIFVM